MEKRDLAFGRIVDIFRKELEEPELELTFASSAKTVAKWDSINNLILITALEEEFDVDFPIDVILKADNIGDLCDYLVQNSTKI